MNGTVFSWAGPVVFVMLCGKGWRPPARKASGNGRRGRFHARERKKEWRGGGRDGILADVMTTQDNRTGATGEYPAQLKWAWLLAVALGVGAAVLYGVTRCAAVAPGVPAYRLWGALPGVPNPSILTPLWNALMRAGRGLVSDWAAWGTAWSVLFGALGVGLVSAVATRVRFKVHDAADPDEGRREHQARYLAGLVTGLFLMGSLPVWVAATRTVPDAMHLALLGLAAFAFSEYQRAGKAWRLVVFGAIYGVGLAEFPSFWALAPMAAILVVRAMLQRAEFSWVQAVQAGVAAAVVGVALLALSAAYLAGEQALALQGISGFWPALWLLVKKQGASLISMSHGGGWLLVMLMTYVPWCILFLMRAKKPAWRFSFWQLFLRLIVLAACLSFCFYEPAWKFFNMGALMVTPSAILAVCCGHVVGEFWVMGQWREHKGAGVGHVLRTIMGVVALLLVAAVAVAGVLNAPRADGGAASALARAAAQTASSLGDGGVVLSDNLLDAAMAVAASDAGTEDFTILNAENAKVAAHRDYLAQRVFTDARSQALLALGFGPFIQDYVMRDGVLGRFGALSLDETLRGAGYLVPDGLLSRIRTVPLDEVGLLALAGSQKPFWEEMAALAAHDVDELNPLRPFQFFVCRRASKQANNVGFMLLDVGYDAEAEEVLKTARRIDKGNLSALLNLLTLAQRLGRADEAAAYLAEWQEFAERQTNPKVLWSLASAFGYIHNTRMLMEQGMTWAASGKPRLAEAELRRTVKGEASAKLNDDLRSFLGQMYLANGDLDQGEAYYLQLREEHPEDPNPLYRLAQLDIQRGDIASAEEKFATLEGMGVSAESFRLEKAMIAMAKDRQDEAIRLLQDASAANPKDVRSIALLHIVADKAGRTEVADKALETLRRMPNRDFSARLVTAQLLLHKKEWTAARAELEALARMNRAQPRVWEMLLRIDYAERKRELAEDHVRVLLTLEPQNTYGNLLLASFQRERGQLALAESSYRAALAADRSPAVLNDLADLLIHKSVGGRGEAHALLDEAIAMAPGELPIMATRVELNILDQRYAEAEADLARILTVVPDEPTALFLSARLELAQGHVQAAQVLADTIYEKRDALSPSDQEAFREFRSELDRASSAD